MRSKNTFCLLLLASLASCGSGDRSIDYLGKAASTQADTAMPTKQAPDNPSPLNSPDRKIKRTADFHCRVPNVLASVTNLEKMVKESGGVVQESLVENNNHETKTSYYTPDSLKQTLTYTTTAFLTLRIPSKRLDSIINAIPGLTSFIDSRTLKQSDVTYHFMANELKNQGEANYSEKELKMAKKSNEMMEVQQFGEDKSEQKINRKIENLQIMDDVTYATLTVAFSQPVKVFKQVIANPDYITGTPFILRCEIALNEGTDILSAIVVAMVTIWPVLLVITGWLTYRKIRRKAMMPVQQ